MKRGRPAYGPRPNLDLLAAERRLGSTDELLKTIEALPDQTESQKKWLECAKGAVVIVTETLTEATKLERLAERQLGAIDYFIEKFKENARFPGVPETEGNPE